MQDYPEIAEPLIEDRPVYEQNKRHEPAETALKIKPRKSYSVLGVEISPYSTKEFFQLIEQQFSNNKKKIPPLFVVTVNPEIIIQSITDSEFKKILDSSAVNTADGVGVSWAVNRLYGEKVERITGSDSLEKICRLCARNHQSVFFYGAAPGVASSAAEKLRRNIPGLRVAGTFSPGAPDLRLSDLPAETADQLRSADVVFVALGAPSQEKWIYKNLPHLPNCKVIAGIGGSFDFITGNVKRAPAWMCKTGLEWVYRLWLQPSRWRRMLKLPVFVLNVILLKWINPETPE